MRQLCVVFLGGCVVDPVVFVVLVTFVVVAVAKEMAESVPGVGEGEVTAKEPPRGSLAVVVGKVGIAVELGG